MQPLLFLCQRIPYPPNKGDKLTTFAIMRHLAQQWDIHLGCFIDDPDDWQHVPVLRGLVTEIYCEPLHKTRATVKSAIGLITGRSLSEHYFRSASMARWVDAVIASQKPPVIFAYSSVMGAYVWNRDPSRIRLITDYADVDSEKWRQYADQRHGVMRWVYRRESRCLLAFERRLAERSDATILISPAEAALFRRLAPHSAHKIHAVSNGVDHAYFAPDSALPNPYPATCQAIVMTGAMDYWPNIDAARWFAEAMLPALRAHLPRASFYIVGANPSAELRQLGERAEIVVTGRVADVRPYIAHAAAVVAPMRIARGIQNKILEGMAMGKAVITTSPGLEGIVAEPDRDLLVADDPATFTAAILGVIDNADRAALLGQRARARILSDYDWSDKLRAIDRLVAGVGI